MQFYKVIFLSIFLVLSNIHAQSNNSLFEGIKKQYEKIILNDQYMRSSTCKLSAVHFPNWENFPVQDCSYTSHQMNVSVSTKAYLLFPDAEKLTNWTINACIDIKHKDVEFCALKLMQVVRIQSAGQFPIAGFVVEPPMGKNWKHPTQPYCYLFRNGVTVTTASWPETSVHTNHTCGPESVNLEPIVKAMTYGRVTGVTRKEYVYAGGKLDAGKSKNSVEFSDVIGKEFRLAWNTERNFLFYSTALTFFH